MEKKWQVENRTEADLFSQLLKNRGLKSQKDIDLFLHPSLAQLTDPFKIGEMKKAVDRVLLAMEKEEPIVVYGDFDVDGITGTAILWETLFGLGAKVTPYIPHRVSEGYGLHTEAIEKFAHDGVKVVISVDCGITAVEEARLAKAKGIDLIITDHHHPLHNLPEPYALVHTESLAGSGVAFKLAWGILQTVKKDFQKEDILPFIDLAACGTIADMVPLVGESRVIAHFGIEEIKNTHRLGLSAMMEEAGIKKENLRVYDISFVMAPRLNAMGRLESAMDSLRLLLTKNQERAQRLAQRLADTNRERQRILTEGLTHAQELIATQVDNKIIILAHESYAQGVIGLIAGRVVEQTGKPAIVISKEAQKSKGSARSIAGLSIVESLAECADLLLNHGGHHMAAGFTIPTDNIEKFQERLNQQITLKLDGVDLVPVIKVEAQLNSDEVNLELFDQLDTFKPFGIGNPEPLFLLKNVEVLEKKLVGKTNNHLKMTLKGEGKYPVILETIGFGMGDREIKLGETIDIVFTLSDDSWNGKRRLVLKLKDLKTSTTVNT